MPLMESDDSTPSSREREAILAYQEQKEEGSLVSHEDLLRELRA